MKLAIDAIRNKTRILGEKNSKLDIDQHPDLSFLSSQTVAAAMLGTPLTAHPSVEIFMWLQLTEDAPYEQYLGRFRATRVIEIVFIFAGPKRVT